MKLLIERVVLVTMIGIGIAAAGGFGPSMINQDASLLTGVVSQSHGGTGNTFGAASFVASSGIVGPPIGLSQGGSGSASFVPNAFIYSDGNVLTANSGVTLSQGALNTTLGISPVSSVGYSVMKAFNNTGAVFIGMDNAAGTGFGSGGANYGVIYENTGGMAFIDALSGLRFLLSASGVNFSSPIASSGKTVISNTAPTITAGFGAAPSITAANTAAMRIVIGGGGTAQSGILALPTASNGWVCNANDLTSPSNFQPAQYLETVSSVGIQNYSRLTGAPIAFGAGDEVHVSCMGY